MKLLDDFFKLVAKDTGVTIPEDPGPPADLNPSDKAEIEDDILESKENTMEVEQGSTSSDDDLEGDGPCPESGVIENSNKNPVVSVTVPPQVEPYTKGGMRYELVFEGVCVHCAHCGLALTDSESIERGLGPICSKKGYMEEVEPKDSTEAMLALAEYPKLVDYLVNKYKDKGNRGLVNGLTRTASLNRRTPVHAACTDAIDALGYKKLASALRESISSIEIFDVKDNPNDYGLWIKRSDFSWDFYNKLRKLTGVRMVKHPKKATLVPRTHRMALAQLIVETYSGLYVKTATGTSKIGPQWFRKAG
jgi:hypothetical protein